MAERNDDEELTKEIYNALGKQWLSEQHDKIKELIHQREHDAEVRGQVSIVKEFQHDMKQCMNRYFDITDMYAASEERLKQLRSQGENDGR